MIFLVNPSSRAERRRKMKSVRKAAKRGTRRASGPSLTRGKRVARPLSSASKVTRRNGGKMAAKKKVAKRRKVATRRKATTKRRKRSVARKSPVSRLARGKVYVTNGRKRRRGYRRNARIGISGIGASLMRSGKDALGVLAGVAGTNLISRRIPFGDGNKAIEIAKKVVVAAGLGMLVSRFASRAMGEKVLVGGMVAVGMDLLRDVPMVGTALAGDEDVRYLASTGLSAYPMVGAGGMSSWAGAGAAVDAAGPYRN